MARLFSTTLFLIFATLKNRIRFQLRRARQPRYLAGLLAGLFYFWWLLGRRVSTGGADLGEVAEFWRLGLLAFGVVSVAWIWVLGRDEPSLTYTEAEILFLFPAPLSRRQLLHYRLWRTHLAALFITLMARLFAGRGLSSHPVIFAVGAALALATLTMHGTFAAFFRAYLQQRGVGEVARRAISVAVGLVFLALATSSLNLPVEELSADSLKAWVQTLASSSSWVLWPIRTYASLAFSESLPQLLTRLPYALAISAAHYAAVLALPVRFEEASVAASAIRASRIERMRNRQAPVRAAGKFALSTRGSPMWAVTWKGLIAFRRTGGRLLIPFVAMLSVAALASSAFWRDGGPAQGLFYVLTSVVAVLALFGPFVVTTDLRHELKRLDILHSWPLEARAIAWGELLGPWVVLTAAEWVALLGAFVPFMRDAQLPLGAGDRLGVSLAALVAVPAFTLAVLVVCNLGGLFFPDLMGAERQRGIEAMGQRMLMFAGTVLTVAFAGLPAALVFALVALALHGLLGGLGLALAGLAAALALFAVCVLGVRALAALLRRTEPSEV